jgi:5-keto-L-gluconate epimerase
VKLSVVIAGDNAPESAFVVWRGYKMSIAKAAALGYDGVELALGGADDVDEAQISEWLVQTGLVVSCISTGLTFAQRGLYMTNPAEAVRERTIETFLGLIRLAERWGGLVNVGRARGFVDKSQTRDQAEALFLACMERLLPEAQKRGVTIMIEPINRYESNFLNSVDDAAQLLARLNSPNVGIMADVFHMNIEDDDICKSLERNQAFVRYVHIADSNRKAPGMGHTDFAKIVSTLRAFGYDGWLGVEILPGDDPDEMAKRAVRHMRALL